MPRIEEGLTQEQLIAYEKQLTDAVPPERIETIFHRMKGMRELVMRNGVDYYRNQIYAYYRSKPFTEQDSQLCEDLFTSKKDLYAIAICDVGAEHKDYRSTFITAKLYWEGRGFLRPQDIEYAISILHDLIWDDQTGEATYYLGMLLKNYHLYNDNPTSGYCYLKRAESFGYRRATEALGEFTHTESIRCKI